MPSKMRRCWHAMAQNSSAADESKVQTYWTYRWLHRLQSHQTRATCWRMRANNLRHDGQRRTDRHSGPGRRKLDEFFGLNSNAADIWMPRAKAHVAREFAIRADDPQRRRDWGWSGVRSGFGYDSKAPRWVQRSGLEWSFRMAVEPRRLFRRYLFVVPSVSLLHGRDVHQ